MKQVLVFFQLKVSDISHTPADFIHFSKNMGEPSDTFGAASSKTKKKNK